jgi:hypothetical protein
MTGVVVALILAVSWLGPIGAAIWALVTLNRMRAAQEDMRGSLERIERLLQQS